VLILILPVDVAGPHPRVGERRVAAKLSVFIAVIALQRE